MKLRAYAKINLSLDVIKKRPDSYHEIRTIMQKISLYDELEFKKIDQGFRLICQEESLANEDNLIYKAHKALENYCGKSLPMEVKLEKNIPLAAGLAGGSSDGAASLLAINEIYNLSLGMDELSSIGKSLGADFPYMLREGTYLAEGIGEKLKKVSDFSDVDLLIVNPGYEVSTKEVYSNLKLNDKRINFDNIISSLEKRDFDSLRILFENKMEDYVFIKHPELRAIKDDLNKEGIPLMSGSGPTIFALFDSRDKLFRAYDKYKSRYKHVYMAKTIGEDYD
jgi:4-diphosphocytidyl-2-C-methyl-D-erythritol kinase